MVVGLVDAGIITFMNSLGVIFGANLGTTIVTQLIAFRLTLVAPYIVIVGFLLNAFQGKYQKFGKPIFYFGVVFFCLSLISLLIEPLAANENIIALFERISNLPLAILVGIVLTLFLQASSVVGGLAIVLVTAGFLSYEQAFGIILGANIGTTSTALIAAIGMNSSAKRAAVAHFMFNVLGVLFILPFLKNFSDLISWMGGSVSLKVANAHLFFNLLSVIFFLLFIKPFAKIIEFMVPEKRHIHTGPLEKL
jgi:phosphate:Na+ symporter